MNKIPDYDKDFCGTIPLHRINHIQDYGCLIITDRQLEIIQVSENTEHLTGVSFETLIGKNIATYLAPDILQRLKTSLAQQDNIKFSFSISRFNDEPVNLLAVVNVREGYLLFELEQTSQPQRLFTDAYQYFRNSISTIQAAETLSTLLNLTVMELKRLSGFDKVMVYKFDDQWHGHVVAEAMEEGMDSYLGLHFPASDIPQQARELYQKNPYRLIPDADYKPVQLFPLINPLASGFVDMSTCNLRGVAKVHTEYLKNMHVQASMSTRIMKDNKLWGLISCHHRVPLFMNFDECLVFELVSNVISSRLSAIEVREEARMRQKLNSIQTTVIESLYAERSLRRGITQTFDTLMEMFDCTGAVLVQQSKVYSGGACPSAAELEDLLNWLQAQNLQKPMVTNCLQDVFVDAEAIAKKASGIVVLPIISDTREFVICFRKEIENEVHWGGNPNDAVQFEADAITYHPRNSFAMWKQTVRNTSKPFSKTEMDVAYSMHSVLLNFRLMELSKQV